MRYEYCPKCGAKLILKEIGDEGLVPYCEKCLRPYFDGFSSCVIGLVHNGDKVAVLRQKYISNKYCNLVSGYMKPGESAEEAMRREVKEELGLDIKDEQIVGTYWFGRDDVLMIGFIAETEQTELLLSKEVDEAYWAEAHEALSMVHPSGCVSHTLAETFVNMLDGKNTK